MTEQAKIFVLDIETAPVLAYVWDLKDQNVSVNQIYQDRYVIAWAGKWYGAPESAVIYRDQRGAKNIEDDRAILRELWNQLDAADIVVTQNGKNFDSPMLNARFIVHGMRPPSPYKHLDTYQIVRHTARFTSNKLEYLTEKLCTKYKKLQHEKYPGFTLWKECLRGNIRAWNVMRRYNVHDVLSTEELYTKIRAWVPENAPQAYPVGKSSTQCGVCGAVGLLRAKGYNYSRVSRFRKYVCRSCGKWTFGQREAL